MITQIRSAVLPLLITMGLSAAMVLGVQDLERHSRAVCGRQPPRLAPATQSQSATETPIGGFYLSRFDKRGLFGCQGEPVALPAAVQQ